MRALLLAGLGGFVAGAALMLALVFWILSDTEDSVDKRFPWQTS